MDYSSAYYSYRPTTSDSGPRHRNFNTNNMDGQNMPPPPPYDEQSMPPPPPYDFHGGNDDQRHRQQRNDQQRPTANADGQPNLFSAYAWCSAQWMAWQERMRRANEAHNHNSGGRSRQNDGGNAWQDFNPANFERYASQIATDSAAYVANILATFLAGIFQLVFVKISGFLYRASISILWLILRYTVLAPILTPYYTARAYWRRAELIWRTSQSLWKFLCRTWVWWTGGRPGRQQVRSEINSELAREWREQSGNQQRRADGGIGGKTRPEPSAPPQYVDEMEDEVDWDHGSNYWSGPSPTEEGQRQQQGHNRQQPMEEEQMWRFNFGEYAIWLFLYLPLVCSVCWLFYHYYWPARAMEKLLTMFNH